MTSLGCPVPCQPKSLFCWVALASPRLGFHKRSLSLLSCHAEQPDLPCHMSLALKSLSKDILSAAGWNCLVCATCFQLSGCKTSMSWLCASAYLSPLLISRRNLICVLIFAVLYFAVFYSNFPSSSVALGSCWSLCRGAQPPVCKPRAQECGWLCCLALLPCWRFLLGIQTSLASPPPCPGAGLWEGRVH